MALSIKHKMKLFKRNIRVCLLLLFLSGLVYKALDKKGFESCLICRAYSILPLRPVFTERFNYGTLYVENKNGEHFKISFLELMPLLKDSHTTYQLIALRHWFKYHDRLNYFRNERLLKTLLCNISSRNKLKNLDKFVIYFDSKSPTVRYRCDSI